MFSTLRTRFGIPGVISVMALVFAMFGGAYAASNSSNGGKATASAAKGKPGPRGKTGKTGPAGPQGPAGPAGPAGAKGDTGSAGSNGSNGANGKTVLNGVGAPAAGLGSEGDFYIDTNVSEIYGPKKNTGWGVGTSIKGEEGSPWVNGGTLPSEATETGVWGLYPSVPAEEEGPYAFQISFPIPLETEPEPIFLKPGELSKPGCPGVAEGIPQADPGKLCVYASKLEEATDLGFSKPLGNGLPPGAGKTGTILKVNCEAFCTVGGTWAVTAE